MTSREAIRLGSLVIGMMIPLLLHCQCSQRTLAPLVAKENATSQTCSASAPATRPIVRDARGRIVRSERARREFMRQTGYPHGRPGYVIDHITPLKRGGADEPSNMQWQTVEDAKAKDRLE